MRHYRLQTLGTSSPRARTAPWFRSPGREAQAFAARLAAATVTLTGKAGEEGKLFGSVTAQDIADGLAQQGIQVDRRRIELEHPIKLLGFHTVTVRLHPEVHAEVRVQVVAE